MKTANTKLPIIIGIILVLVIVIVGIILAIGNRGYRVIKVDKVSGEASLEREDNEQDIYENINLQSEDAVITGQDGQVELLIDSDKHVLARENTKFKVVSNGKENKGKLKIELQYGTSLVEIKNKLPKDAFFEVETPNATIGVRGTIFETSYYEEENKTVVVVTSGVVEVASDDESVTVEAGQSVIVEEDDIEVVAEDDDIEADVEDENKQDDMDANMVGGIGFPIRYSATDYAFNLRYMDGKEDAGISVRKLEGYIPEFGLESPTNYYMTNEDNSNMYIEYFLYHKDEAISQINTVKLNPELFTDFSMEYMLNYEYDIICCIKYYHIEQNALCYSYVKKIAEDMYLCVRVTDRLGGQILEEDSYETFLQLTKDGYYDYSTDLTLDTEMDIIFEQ